MSASVERPHVLIIEADSAAQAWLESLLGGAGYAVTVLGAGFGVQAQCARTQPAAVVLDATLPYRSGLAVLRELKSDARTANIPVVLLAADGLLGSYRDMASAVVPKPLDQQALLFAVRAACPGDAPRLTRAS